MISFLEGNIEYLGDKYVILSANGIGYKVIVSPKVLNILSKNQFSVNSENVMGIFTSDVKMPITKFFIHSQLNMREGTFDMYGFQNREDLELFHLITSVNGIGPKSAMAILSVVEPKYLKAAVVNENVDYLKRVSGLGPKTASRLILELKNKVGHIDMGDMEGVDLGQEGQAIEALLALGYTQYQAKEALKESTLRRADSTGLTTGQGKKAKTLEERVREALRLLGKK